MKTGKKYKYKEARFVKGKRPHITFRTYNRATGQELYRVRDYTYKVYNQETIERINWINDHLKKGFTVNIPPQNQATQTKASFTLVDGLEFYFKHKRINRQATSDSYNSQSRLFTDFLVKKGYLELDISSFTKLHVLEYLDDMNAKKLSSNTINSRLFFLSGVFTFLVEREKVKENPVLGVKKEKGKSKTKILLLPDEQQRMLEILHNENEKLYMFVMFLFHNFIRVKELTHLQRQYINLAQNRLTIPEDIAKRNWRRTIITPPLKELIIRHKLYEGDPALPIFPNPQGQPHGKSYFRNLYCQIRDKHGFSYSHKLYHWKDMGVSAYYREFKDIIFVKNQCGHQSLDMTYKYLDKDLGVIETDLDFGKSPRIIH